MKTAEPSIDPYLAPNPSVEPGELLRFRGARVRMLLAVMFCYLFYYTGRQVFGFAIPGITGEFKVSKEDLGWCGLAMLWAYAAGQAVNGQLADRLGGRRMMALGALLSCGLCWMLSFSQSVLAIGTIWAINGYAQSLGWAPGSRILSNWWEKEHRGIVYGCYLLAAGLGSVVAYIGATTARELGWRAIFQFPVLLMLVGAVVFWLVARDRPSDLGLANLRPESGEKEDVEHESAWARYRVALTNGRFMIGSLSIGFQNLARYGLLIWVPVYFFGKEWADKSPAGKWISVFLPVGMAVGAVTSGWLSDRVFGGNRGRVIVIFLCGAAASAFSLWLLPKEHGLVAPMLFFAGFFVYGPQAGYWALCPDLLGRRHAGTGTGVMNFFSYLIGGLGEPLIGRLCDHVNNAAVFPVVATACVISAGLMLLVRR